MLAPLRVVSGSASAPSLSFTSGTGSGLYYETTPAVSMAVATAQSQKWTATGSMIPGTLDVTGAATVGGTLGVTGVATFTGIPVFSNGFSTSATSTLNGFISNSASSIQNNSTLTITSGSTLSVPTGGTLTAAAGSTVSLGGTTTIGGGIGGGTALTGLSFGTCGLNSASPSTCSITVLSGTKCGCFSTGTAGAGAGAVQCNVSATTATCYGVNGAADTVLIIAVK